MKKRNVFRVIALLLFIGLLSCEKEKVLEESSSIELGYNAKELSSGELENTNPNVSKIAQNYVDLLNVIQTGTTARNDINDFEVIRENIIYLEKGDYDSYTFPVIRNGTDDIGFENLLISKQKDNSYKAMLVRYRVSDDEKRKISEGEVIDFDGKVDFLDIDYEIESLLTSRGGVLNVCPPGKCCETVTGSSQGTGLPILTLKVVPCGDEGSGDDQGSGGGSGGGGGSDSPGGPTSGGATGNEGTPNGGGTGSGGSGTSGGNDSDGSGPSDDDAPCVNCIGDGTSPTLPPFIPSPFNNLINALNLPFDSPEVQWLTNSDNSSEANSILDRWNLDGGTSEATTSVKMSVRAELARTNGSFNFSKSGEDPLRPALKWVAEYNPPEGGTMFLLENGLVMWESPSRRRINKLEPGSIANTEISIAGEPFYYAYSYDSKKWFEYRRPPQNTTIVDVNYLIDAFWEGAKFTGRYIVPVEDIVILIDGKDFDNIEQSRVKAAGFLIIAVLPGAKFGRIVAEVKLFSGGSKFFKIANIAGESVRHTFKITANGAIDFGARNSSKFRKILGLVVGDARNAHHIVSRNLKNHWAIQRIAKSSRHFHIDELLNGVPVAQWRNAPNHPLYDARVRALLDDIPVHLSIEDTFPRVEAIIQRIRTAIVDNPNVHLDDLIF